MKQYYEAFKLAWAMLTAIPLFNNFSRRTDLAGKSVAFYPLVGLLLGLLLWLISVPLEMIFPDTLSPFLLFAIYMLSYGALHTDGLADITDALLSWKKPEEAVEILKDPHIGAQGAVYVMLFVLIKAVIFSHVDIIDFVVIPMVARFGIVFAMFHFPYISSGQMARSQHSQLSKKNFIGAVLSLLFIVPVCGFMAIPFVLITLLSTLYMGKRISARLTGLNGDSYGFIVEINELILLLLCTISF